MINARQGDCYVVDHCDVRVGTDSTGNRRVYPAGQKGYTRHIVDTGVGKINDDNAVRAKLINVLKFYGQPNMETTGGSISEPDGNANCAVGVFQASHPWSTQRLGPV